ncbi:MAG: RNA polymerase sigma factor [Balneola sp.]|nr:RNA polymerase sigma factor [Balneola sp.]MBO6650583.1 RNA polymerase sigma factor [Balneola sp.]MBO6712638.1 RNA polymerase sigma factor [Balneola sp.]MBO6800868.1 RNA polymerase sigma factor [Balneola sp.]MBO6870541.1 RNA polymerase sigma factor [Balneola sp.]
MSDSEFTDLLKPHYNDAVNYCRALCSGASKSEAEDVMQQSLLKAFENFEALKNKASFKSWFFHIITRTFYNSVRKPFWSRFVSLDSEDGKAAFQVFEDSFFEDNQILIAALSKISKKERAAILLFEIGGFSIEEITKIQNEKSESTIKSRLSRTRKKLKEFMVTLEEETVRTQHVASPEILLKSQRTTKDLYHETAKVIKEIKSIG